MYTEMANFVSCVLLLCVAGVQSGNPIVPNVGMADTNVHFFNNTFYVFATHDFSPTNKGFLMKDWWCWSSHDLVHWKIDSIVQPNVSVPWATASEQDECWATDAAFRNNKFYFYLSVGAADVGVITADSTAGPWVDPLGKPLLSDAMARALKPATTFRDPCVFEDEDGEYYIISGVFQYYVAKLGQDMISLAEPLKHVVVNNAYGPCGDHTTDDKPFLHKNNGTYYLSWGCFYATSKSVYGPYETQGAVISTAKLDPSFRMNDTDVAVASDSNNAQVRAPQAGDGVILYECANASAADWVPSPNFRYDGKPFMIHLQQDPTLCITGPNTLTLQSCSADTKAPNANQQFTLKNTTKGLDVNGPTCPCWNVNDFNARAPGDRGVDGAIVQCFSCVDGSDFNPNQRFQISPTSSSRIQAWDGYAKGFCLAVSYPGNPLPPAAPTNPPAPKPWYRHEDYTDRHGSFLEHGGQWYYASNDRSHSSDLDGRAYFRDTVLCYIHFHANGTMEPCVVNAVGVGTYDATSVIEAENYFKIAGNVSKLYHEANNDFVVRVDHKGEVHFPNIFNLNKTGRSRSTSTITITAMGLGASGSMKLYADSATNANLLGSCEVKPDQTDFTDYICDVAGLNKVDAGVFHLVVEFEGQGSILLDRLTFQQ